ncbi:MAG TPA: glycoside hydrolase family 15 protein [Gemmatimonadaceae bacterium]|nr:glycoside hydrolase family 15 protein [Gemmatimonadaceae bacterium]
MTDAVRVAPGWPGIPARWTSAAKSAVGTACGSDSRVWFTASHGILNEIYYPELDTACLRDAGLVVTARDGFRSEEKRDCDHDVEWLAPGVPAFLLRNTCTRFEIEKRVCVSNGYDVVLQHVRFTPRNGSLRDYRVTLIAAPHLGNHGAGNTGWVGTHKGERMLFAKREWLSLAIGCSTPWRECTVGFAGDQDAWNDVARNGHITAIYDRAENGNVALAAEVDLEACGGVFTIGVGFGGDPDTAGLHTRAALMEPFDHVERRYVAAWQGWQAKLLTLDESVGSPEPHLYRASAALLKTHMSMNSDGGAIASLSVPWGASRGDGDLGGYHLVWPRDMVETAGGLLACGAHHEMRAMLRFLAVTQESDGHWPQNMWLNGAPYWSGLQLDETAFPVLLVDLARRDDAITPAELETWWPMVRRAALFIAMNGPATGQDRWEENGGYTPFTLAAEVAALLAAADLADHIGERRLAVWLRDTADDWNAWIERWTYASNTALGTRVGVDGYYVRVGSSDMTSLDAQRIPVKNRPSGEASVAASEFVSCDALALVRFGLRAANDPRIVNTVRVIDAVLRAETERGPVWHRYNQDGYGEHDDGGPFDGTGRGRGWPLLAGERAHYELAAGNRIAALELLEVMRRQASKAGLLPEQVWDAADIPELELFSGRASGSAMPLAWAHAEHVKLVRSLRDGAVFDCPPQTVARYVESANVPRMHTWRFNFDRTDVPAGRQIRIDLAARAVVHWTADNWVTSHDTSTREITSGIHTAELPTSALGAGRTVTFTFYWPESAKWEGKDFRLTLDAKRKALSAKR